LPPGTDAAAADDRVLVAGIRPEAFQDARLDAPQPDDAHGTFTATAELTEWLGSQQYLYVPYESPAELRSELAALGAVDLDALRSQLIISVDPERSIDEGDSLRLKVDAAQIHLFDPRSGRRL